ncbi:MAG: beta-N-acetylhexosaminidase [bacterium]|nr:beta-N-acetylhexosaminidase [bacterium]
MRRPDARSPLDDLVPAVRHWQPAAGTFPLRDLVRVTADADADTGAAGPPLPVLAAGWLSPALDRVLDMVVDPRVALADGDAAGALRLRRDAALPPEHYRLVIAPDRLGLWACAQPGFARGLATLLQLCAGQPDGALPCGTVSDGPAFAWRGLLLDSGRHFQPVRTVLDVLDRLAAFKFNVLHWHLTEDQGWRLEVPGLPRLTEVGAWREQQQGGRHGGFYTADDVRRVVARATELGITVVPEIEMPGHCQAALAAYPELSCTGGPFAVQTQWGIFPDIFCAGREETFAFLEQVLAHVLELFPSPFIHVGGDEAPKDRWRACARCQARIARNGLRDEHELQSWFIRRVGRWLAARGRRLVGWDEILEGDLAGSLPGAVVQSWRGLDGAVTAARAGHDTVVSPTSHAYFDYDPGVLDVARVLAFDPVPPGLAPAEQARVLGGAANLWTEYVPHDRLDAQLFPRLPAMAEALWARPAAREAGAFLRRLQGLEPLYRALNIRPGVAARPLALDAAWDPASGSHTVRWSLVGDLGPLVAGPRPDVRYAVRPAVATAEAPLAVRATLMVDGQPCGAPAVIELVRHRALARPVTVAASAGAGDPRLLVDGVLGSRQRDDGRWFACACCDLDATIDLGEPLPLLLVHVRFLQDANAGIFLPRSVHVLLSDDGVAWRPAGDCTHDVPDRVQERVIVPFSVQPAATARHLRVLAMSSGPCPAWHPEAGRPSRLCADEIVVHDRRDLDRDGLPAPGEIVLG